MNRCWRALILGVAVALVALAPVSAVTPAVSRADDRAASPPPEMPAELRMVLDPGQSHSETILFRTDEGGAHTEEPADPVEEQPEAPLQYSGDRSMSTLSTGYRPTFTLSTGYRRDNLNWSIAGPNNNPNILSELDWDDVKSIELAGSVRWSNSSHLYLRGGAGFGWIVDGEVRDSDYLGNNRSMEFSRSYSDAGDGSLWDASIGAGYRFDLPSFSKAGRIHLIPLVGYSYHVQELSMTDGVQVLSDFGFTVPLGPIAGLKSSYETQWNGPWLGVDLEWIFNRQHALMASLEYHRVDYKAEADWNLRQSFQHPISFRHEAEGDGIVAALGYRYSFTPKWSLTIGGTYRRMTTDDGDDITFFSDGTVEHTRLNEVEWNSYSATVGLTYHF